MTWISRGMVLLWITCCVLVILLTHGKVGAKKNPASFIHSYAGPYKILIKSLGPCPPLESGKNIYIISGCIKQSRERPEPSFYGNMETLEPLTDETTMTTSIAQWNPVSGWVDNAFILPFGKVCTGLRSMTSETVRNLEVHALNGEKFCPRGVGNFTVVGAPAIARMDKIKIFPYAKWRGDIKFFRRNALVGCFRFQTESIPDNSASVKSPMNLTTSQYTFEHRQQIGRLLRNKRSTCAIQGI